MKQIKNILWLLFAVLALASCDTYSEDFDIEYTPIHPIGGTYRISVTDEAGENLYTDYCYLANTTDNSSNQCWLRIGNYNLKPADPWAINGKISCDVASLSFSGASIENLAGNVASSTETFTVTDGKIEMQAATAPSGTKADKISFTFTNSRFPGKTYKADGYRYTGWGED